MARESPLAPTTQEYEVDLVSGCDLDDFAGGIANIENRLHGFDAGAEQRLHENLFVGPIGEAFVEQVEHHGAGVRNLAVLEDRQRRLLQARNR